MSRRPARDRFSRAGQRQLGRTAEGRTQEETTTPHERISLEQFLRYLNPAELAHNPVAQREVAHVLEGAVLLVTGVLFTIIYLIQSLNFSVLRNVPHRFGQFLTGFSTLVIIFFIIGILAFLPKWRRIVRFELPYSYWAAIGGFLLFMIPGRLYLAELPADTMFDGVGSTLLIVGLAASGYGYYLLWRRKLYRICWLVGMIGLVAITTLQNARGFGSFDRALFAFLLVFLYTGMGLYLFERNITVYLNNHLEDINTQITAARKRRSAGDHEEAYRIITRAIRHYPFFEVLWNNRGNIEFDRGRYGAAIKSYRRALELNPTYAYAWNNLGVALRHEGGYTEAVRCHDRALNLSPKYDAAKRNRQLAEEMKKEREAAGDEGMEPIWHQIGNIALRVLYPTYP